MRKKKKIEEEYDESRPEGEEGEPVMGDIYDLYAEGIKNHQKLQHISEDIFLSDLHGDGNEGDEEKFIREQIKLSIVVRRFIQYKPEANIAANAIMIDPQTIVAFSRARKGKIINAILNYGQPRSMPELEPEKGFVQKIFTKKDKGEQE